MPRIFRSTPAPAPPPEPVQEPAGPVAAPTKADLVAQMDDMRQQIQNHEASAGICRVLLDQLIQAHNRAK